VDAHSESFAWRRVSRWLSVGEGSNKMRHSANNL